MKLKLRPGALPEGLSIWHPASLIATWFGSGLMPFASGTWGSLAALPFGWAIGWAGGPWALVLAAMVATLAGWWASQVIVSRGRSHDPGLIVIDEVAGQWLTLACAPLTWWGIAIAFVLFRAADVLKPFPARWCDENIHGGLGVMVDDLIAAAYAGLGTWVLARLVIAYA